MVLDFVGNTRRHRLITPADILAGADDPAAALEEAGRADGDVLVALDAARQAEAERQVEGPKLERLRWATELAELFGVTVRPGGNGEASSAQLQLLERHGLARSGMTKAEAHQVIEAVVERSRLGLATPKQVRLLRRQGINAIQMTFGEADAAIGRLRARWNQRRKGGRA